MQDEMIRWREAAEAIRKRADTQPKIGLVLGSGLGPLADEIEDAVILPYEEIPHWPQSTVVGHSGVLVIGQLASQPVIAQRGRAHFYEGYSMAQVTFPVRVMQQLGAETFIFTNAAGGVNRSFEVGDIMLIEDHINFVGMSGQNPLMGPNEETIGPRFLNLAQAYDAHLRKIAIQEADRLGLTLRKGVYFHLSGPFFETPAEIRLVANLGGDAVGMSTANEVLAAVHGGSKVLAFSGITNQAIDQIDSERKTNHEEVLEAGLVIVPRLISLLRRILKAL
ncbi:MAG: purine-nucleoside phosphorylase [Anaerolineaceae bacterium]|nr:purine-nucleoside phosphorylase [Anaerolineaceae bacterium]